MSKRDELILTALRLFYRHGVHAVGINEVLAESGIAKKTLYKYFASKDALILACVVKRDQIFTEWFISQCSNASSVQAFIECIFSALDDWINGRAKELGRFSGCFFVNVTAEYSNHNDPIFLECKQHKLNIKRFINLQLKRFLESSSQVDFMLDSLVLLKEGVINGAFVMGDMQSAVKAKNLALKLL